MAHGWDSTPVAAKMRDLIISICVNQINKLRPASKYAQIAQIDKTTGTAQVVFPGETDPVPVTFSTAAVLGVGSKVRISGTPGDRYIDESSLVDVEQIDDYTFHSPGIVEIASSGETAVKRDSTLSEVVVVLVTAGTTATQIVLHRGSEAIVPLSVDAGLTFATVTGLLVPLEKNDLLWVEIIAAGAGADTLTIQARAT